MLTLRGKVLTFALPTSATSAGRLRRAIAEGRNQNPISWVEDAAFSRRMGREWSVEPFGEGHHEAVIAETSRRFEPGRLARHRASGASPFSMRFG
jgi:hypothetical protein